MDLIEPAAGQRHPWEVRRAAFFAGVLRKALAGRARLDVLDVGAGDAYFASGLSAAVPGIRSVTCYDPNYDAETLLRLGGMYPSLAFRRSRPEQPSSVVLMLDVLEHVDDDESFITEVVRDCVSTDGLVLVSVPAWQALSTRHDDFLVHHRRYAPATCDRLLVGAGLEILKRGGAFHSLVLPRAATALREKVASRTAKLPALAESNIAWNHGSVVTGLVTGALHLDNLASRVFARAGVNVPGLSYWALTRRVAR